jgi:hypothetical protein
MTMLLSAQVKAQILRILLAASGEPVPATTLRDGLRLSFPHVAFSEADPSAKSRTGLPGRRIRCWAPCGD